MRARTLCLGKLRCLSPQQQPKDILPPPLKGWETERLTNFSQRGERLKTKVQGIRNEDYIQYLLGM
ncbi:hypothetical protein RhiirB3_454024 [Rhizophagus irregularis]|nr:hypothetical protein RhiirB3_454024 [Rhizophagus irregularis]